MTYRSRKKAEEDFVAIAPPRVYADTELRDFHNKIQKFWDEPRTLETGGIAQRFDHQRLHVAYGAAIRVAHGSSSVLLYNERMEGFRNLWGQYESWRGKQDWIEQKQAEQSAEVAGIPF